MRDRSWKVLASWENRPADRCVDIFQRGDGSFGFEEYRRDAEDAGRWTPVAYHAYRIYSERASAEAAAAATIVWLETRN